MPQQNQGQGSIFALTNHEIYAISVAHLGRLNAQIATWVLPASLGQRQPRLLVVMSTFNWTHELLEASGRFVVHGLAEGQEPWLARFGLASGREVDKLEGIECSATASGLPILPGTCGWAEAVVADKLALGDRTIFVGDIVAQAVEPGRQPLRLREALARLPAEIRQALQHKRQQDSARDDALLEGLRRSARPARSAT